MSTELSIVRTLIIQQYEDGDIDCSLAANDGEVVPTTIQEAIGIVETAKQRLILQYFSQLAEEKAKQQATGIWTPDQG